MVNERSGRSMQILPRTLHALYILERNPPFTNPVASLMCPQTQTQHHLILPDSKEGLAAKAGIKVST